MVASSLSLHLDAPTSSAALCSPLLPEPVPYNITTYIRASAAPIRSLPLPSVRRVPSALSAQVLELLSLAASYTQRTQPPPQPQPVLSYRALNPRPSKTTIRKPAPSINAPSLLQDCKYTPSALPNLSCPVQSSSRLLRRRLHSLEKYRSTHQFGGFSFRGRLSASRQPRSY